MKKKKQKTNDSFLFKLIKFLQKNDFGIVSYEYDDKLIVNDSPAIRITIAKREKQKY